MNRYVIHGVREEQKKSDTNYATNTYCVCAVRTKVVDSDLAVFDVPGNGTFSTTCSTIELNSFTICKHVCR